MRPVRHIFMIITTGLASSNLHAIKNGGPKAAAEVCTRKARARAPYFTPCISF